MSPIVPTTHTPVDATTTDPAWTLPQSLTIAVRPVTPDLRRTHFDLPRHARFVLVEYDTERAAVIATNVEHVNLVAFGRLIAQARGARFVEPDATCEYCGLPVPADARWCTDTDCQMLDGGRETAWWRDYPHNPGLALTGGGWAA